MRTPLLRLRALLLVASMVGALLSIAAPASAVNPFPWSPPIGPTHFVTMSDGIQIAINVRMPKGFVAGQKYPTIFEMSGYDGASNNDKTFLGYTDDEFGNPGLPLQEGSRQLTKWFYDNYVTIHASVRGTGCSGGEFDLFSWRSALDGREVIDWIARQGWSNGKVGLMGHSYSGITAFMVAATRPAPLVAITTSGLIDDLYRGITYPGGVSNYGFPLLWTGAVRPAYDYLGATAQPLVTDGNRAKCAANIATHRRTVLNDPIPQGIGDTDNEWFKSRSLINYAHLIDVPIHIVGAYQDEQTSARGPAHLWESISGVPKRLILSNGSHGTNQSSYNMTRERVPWMDHWMRGVDKGHGTLAADEKSVAVHLETVNGRPGSILNAPDFPIPSMRWTKHFMRAGGGITTTPPAANEGSSRYVSGTKRQSWNYETGENGGQEFSTPDGPDELTFRTQPMTAPMAVIGPITANLHLATTATDTELFVQLIDEAPDGSRSYLQRGLLRASHLGFDPGQSDAAADAIGRVEIYRPYRPHTNAQLIIPNRVYNYLVEIWPVGHVFRAGHRLVVKVHAPPASDSLNVYVPKVTPAINTLFHSNASPSKLTLPIVPLTGVTLGPEPACGAQDAVRCIPG